MPTNLLSSRLAAKAGTRQVEAVLKADVAAEAADRVVRRIWAELLKILQTPFLSPRAAYDRAHSLLLGLRPSLEQTLADSLGRVARWSHGQTADALTQMLPLDLLRAAAPPIPLPEAEPGSASFGLDQLGRFRTRDRASRLREPVRDALSADQQRRLFKRMLFPAPDLTTVERIVKAPGAAGTWQDRLGAATRLAPPDRLARRIAGGFAAGKTPQEIARDLRTELGGVRSAARRLARTESHRVANTIAHEAHEELGDMIVGYQVHATLDQHTRPWHAARSGTIYYKRPKQGQKGPAQQPNPPEEPADPRERPAGTPKVAYHCRCYLTPVLAPLEHITSDPAKMTVFKTAQDKLVPDPAVYADWFRQTAERRRRLAVGTRRYSLVRDLLGRDPGWEHFLDPDSGNLLTLDRLRVETAAERTLRLHQVRGLVAARRELMRKTSTFGFLPPRAARSVPVSARPQPSPLVAVPNVVIQRSPWGERAETDAAVNAVFGSPEVDPPKLHAAVGAQPGATITFMGDNEKLTLFVEHPGYKSTRTLHREDEKLICHNDIFEVKEQGQGLGSKILADQVSGLIRLGADRIDTLAVGQKGHPIFNGYYTWPRLGYNAPIPAYFVRQLPPDLASAKTLLDLYDLPGGPEWWKENGSTINVSFDLKPGSQSREVLKDYLREKGLAVPAPLAEAKRRPPKRRRAKAEEIDLNAAEEAALDRVWARRQARKRPAS